METFEAMAITFFTMSALVAVLVFGYLYYVSIVLEAEAKAEGVIGQYPEKFLAWLFLELSLITVFLVFLFYLNYVGNFEVNFDYRKLLLLYFTFRTTIAILIRMVRRHKIWMWSIEICGFPISIVLPILRLLRLKDRWLLALSCFWCIVIIWDMLRDMLTNSPSLFEKLLFKILP